jgi:hypothetical protein
MGIGRRRAPATDARSRFRNTPNRNPRIRPRGVLVGPGQLTTETKLPWHIAFPAILTLISALTVSVITANSSAEIKDSEFQEQRAGEARTARNEAYQGFIKSADLVAHKRGVLTLCIATSPLGKDGCGDRFTETVQAVQALVKVQDGLIIHGSERAVRLSDQIISITADFNRETGQWDVAVTMATLADMSYGKLRRQFQRQICHDFSYLNRIF